MTPETAALGQPDSQDHLTTLIESVVTLLMPRVAETINERFTQFEERLSAEFVKRTEFDLLHRRVDDLNTGAGKMARREDVEDLQQELVKVSAEKHLLETQVTQLIGSQREIRESVMDMREHQAKVDVERANLSSMLNLSTSAFNQARELMTQLLTEQTTGRADREEMRKKYDSKFDHLAAEVRRVEDINQDTERRLIEAITPLHGFAFGDKTHPGIPKLFEDIKEELKTFREEYQKNREADEEAIHFSLAMKGWLKQFVGIFSTKMGGALVAGGTAIGIIVSKILGG